MIKIYCDRCGKEAPNEWYVLYIRISDENVRDRAELCRECMEEIMKFVEKEGSP
jgi:hypothetical protein